MKVPYGVELEEMVELSRWRFITGQARESRQPRSREQGEGVPGPCGEE